ncbi:hypothetical protein ILUMI_09553 [Ignelater luminosus]|uniref:HMG box domain-containing protein n=1 Tax=Ignelater luminosus TaxID=2038154 RepID=A0A8K0GCB5_IGNLU|nr:hypothetical protein ILUMI_09553 [Ignelater luminosus]
MGKNKNQGKNGFYYFMLDFKTRQGRKYTSMAQVAEAAGPHWQRLTQEERRPYDEKARFEKNNQKMAKYTSAGIKIDVVQKQEEEKITKELNMRDYITKSVQNAGVGGIIADQPFYIVHMNHFCYCNATNEYIPAEMAVCRFTLREGVTPENVYHEIVKPGPIPLGYTFDARKQSEEIHQLEVPDNEDPDNLDEVIRKLIKFMKERTPKNTSFPPLYTIEKNRVIAENILQKLCNKYCYEENLFEVYSLEYLFFVLRNSVNPNRPYPSTSSSHLELEKDVYDFCKNIPCAYHQISDVRNYCSRSYVIRLAYIICDNCCGDLNIDLIPGQHVPIDSFITASRSVSRVSSLLNIYSVSTFQCLLLGSRKL